MRMPQRSVLACLLTLALATIAGSCGEQDPRDLAADDKPPHVDRDSIGAPGVSDSLFPGAGNGGYDALHYDLDLTVVPGSAKGAKADRVLSGSAAMTAKATQKLSRFNLDLSGLEVHKVTVDGRPAWYRHKGTELVITPRKRLAKGAEFKVVVAYDGNPKALPGKGAPDDGWRSTDDGAFVMGEPRGAMTWYPVNNTLRDPATYDIDITVPGGLTGVSNGTYAGKKAAGDGKQTFSWRNKDQTLPYLTALAVGKFELKQGKTASGVPVVTAIDPRQAAKGRQLAERIPEFVEWGERHFGPYPVSSAGAILDHDPGNQVALETIGRPVYGEVPEDTVFAHEYAHMWFGDSVRLTDWSEIWLNEGFATYAMWMWDDEHDVATMEDQIAAYSDMPAVWEYPPGKVTRPDRVFGAPVYIRGALALHQLRLTVGDKTFTKILKAWTSRYAGKAATVKDFIALAEEESGKSLTKLFDEWLFQPGRPSGF
ncbi:M1 family metallopeptidase [Streptomyces sp. NBC_01304]|uniref:M1 family metallopeptidase n=1 Tax=Streptomyces sp. NBC_01304 TaxID=2903818 RepID=UPI002E15587D|nr:M1 family metallopeptidase [Streptomyces sp. NBC_01304]